LWVDAEYSGEFDNSEPYQLEFIATNYLPGSQHVIVARAIDNSNNIADSSPITLTISPGFMKTYGSTQSEEARAVIQTVEGGYLLAGNGNGNVLIVKTDDKGNSVWQREYGGSSWGEAHAVIQSSDGGYVIAGSGGPDHQMLLLKIDQEGNEVWLKYFKRGIDYDEGNAIQETLDGGYVITGCTNFTGHRFRGNLWLLKTDATGNLEWESEFGGSNYDVGHGVLPTSEGGYIVVGGTGSYTGGGTAAWMIKTDEFGNEEWDQIYRGENIGGDCGLSIISSEGGGYTISGYKANQPWVIKVDASGFKEWEKVLAEGIWGMSRSIEQSEDFGYIIVGTIDNNDSSQDVHLIKIDATGGIEWQWKYGGMENDDAYSVQQTTDGGYVIGGMTNSYGDGMADMFLIKTDSEGNTIAL